MPDAAGWKYHGGKGSIASDGVLQVSGSGNDCTFFLSEPGNLKGGHCYMVTFEARMPEKVSGAAITGLSQ